MDGGNGFPPVPPPRFQAWEQPHTLLRGQGDPPGGRRGLTGSPGGGSFATPTSDVGGPLVWVGNAQQYASIISVEGLNIPTAVSLRILDQPVCYRNFLAFRNVSAAANIFFKFGGEASINSVFKLKPDMMILFDAVVPQDDLYVIADAGAAVLSVAYSTVQLPVIPPF